MNYILENRDILYNNEQLGPYPDHLLPRVDKVTNLIDGATPKRKSPNDNANARLRKKLGTNNPEAMKDLFKKLKKTPLTQAFGDMRIQMVKQARNPNPVANEVAPIPEDPRVLSRHIKSLGYFLGADQIGICEIPHYAMFLDDVKGNEFIAESINYDYKYAIVLLKRKQMRTTMASTGYDWIFDACSHQCYNQLIHWSETMANYIRRLGFDATGSYMGYYSTVMTTLVLAAGLGESGRMGLAVNPFFGANFKSACVMTSMPLQPDKPIDFGLQEYCKTCGICAQQCVSKAISPDNDLVEYNGYSRYKMDYDRCAALGQQNVHGEGCGRCSNICPWNRPDSEPHHFQDWDGSLETLYDSVNNRARYLREHNFVTEESTNRKWWFELQEKDGKLVIPEKTKYTVVP